MYNYNIGNSTSNSVDYQSISPRILHKVEQFYANNESRNPNIWLPFLSKFFPSSHSIKTSTTPKKSKFVFSVNDKRFVLDEYLKIFPSDSLQWRRYLELEITEKNYSTAYMLSKRCLVVCFDTDVYYSYLNIIEQSTTVDDPLFQRKMEDAFAYVLQCIGYDFWSMKIWRRYLEFRQQCQQRKQLKNGRRMDEIDGDFLNSMRRLYGTILHRPMHGLDKLWNDYKIWEQKYAPRLASQLILKLRPNFDRAKQLYCEWNDYRRGIRFHLHAVPVINDVRITQIHCTQIALWRDLISWEMKNYSKNPVRKYLERVTLVFKQALMVLRLYPDIWLMFIEFAKKFPNSKNEDLNVKKLFKTAVQTVSKCVLLRILYCEYLEFTNAKEVNTLSIALLLF